MDHHNLKFIIRDLVQLTSNRQRESLSGANWYYFLHIPKTAGTSFRFSLYNYFSPKLVYPHTVEYYLKNKSQYISWSDFIEQESGNFPHRKKLLIGHFGLNPLDHYHEHLPKTLCFLRDPVKRVISTVVYHQQKKRKFANMTIDQILDKHLLREGNLQSIYFGYDLQKDNRQETLDNLKKLEFVGISEQFDRSLKLCNRIFNWDLKPVKPRNVGKYKISNFTNEQINRIKNSTNIDRILYNTAVDIFNRRCKEFNVQSHRAFKRKR